MRNLFTFMLACFFLWRCSANHPADATTTTYNDTFPFFNGNEIEQLPEGFVLDTLQKPGKQCDYCETVIVPVLTGNENDLQEILQQEILRQKNKEIVTEEKDTAGLQQVQVKSYAEIVPLAIGMYKNMISYGFLNLSMDEGAMRPYRHYFSVNYDTAQRKFIYFTDFFSVSSKADSAIFKSIVYDEYENFDLSFYDLDNDIIFSSDNENVYFYFDMFGFANNPYGIAKAVKRKYINQFIRKEYQ